MGTVEEVGKVGAATVSAMSNQPLALALLVVNIGFLGFAGYVLGEVAANASVRNKQQMDLIEKLVLDIRDCRSLKPTGFDIYYPPSQLDLSPSPIE